MKNNYISVELHSETDCTGVRQDSFTCTESPWCSATTFWQSRPVRLWRWWRVWWGEPRYWSLRGSDPGRCEPVHPANSTSSLKKPNQKNSYTSELNGGISSLGLIRFLYKNNTKLKISISLIVSRFLYNLGPNWESCSRLSLMSHFVNWLRYLNRKHKESLSHG